MRVGIAFAMLGAPQTEAATIGVRLILETSFQTGDIPTRDQFANLTGGALDLVDDQSPFGRRA